MKDNGIKVSLPEKALKLIKMESQGKGIGKEVSLLPMQVNLQSVNTMQVKNL